MRAEKMREISKKASIKQSEEIRKKNEIKDKYHLKSLFSILEREANLGSYELILNIDKLNSMVTVSRKADRVYDIRNYRATLNPYGYKVDRAATDPTNLEGFYIKIAWI